MITVKNLEIIINGVLSEFDFIHDLELTAFVGKKKKTIEGGFWFSDYLPKNEPRGRYPIQAINVEITDYLGNRKLTTLEQVIDELRSKIVAKLLQQKQNDINFAKHYDQEVKFIYDYSYLDSIDFLEQHELQPSKVKEIFDRWEDKIVSEGLDFSDCQELIADLEKVGWTANYDLSGDLFGLKPFY